jgi:flavin-dependent dehydrogenase
MSVGKKKKLTVSVIGGGPSGSSAAIRLLRKCRENDLDHQVFLFEGKDFEIQYNQCAGVLSPPIEDILHDEMGVELPYAMFKRHIRGYRLHAGGNEILLVGERREGPHFAVRRAIFDRFMLEKASEEGVRVIRSRVTGIEFYGSGTDGQAFIYSEEGTFVSDYVIGAFGLDDGMLDILERSTGRYHRPEKYMTTYVTKFHTDRKFIEKKLGDIIYAFLYPPVSPKVEFGAITPKGDHLVVNIAGVGITVDDFFNFLTLKEVREHLPDVEAGLFSVYRGKFPSSPARGVTGPMYLVTGDATGFLRPFKGKGITTAVQTGIYAADAVVDHYLTGAQLNSYEAKCKELMRDYIFGTGAKALIRVAEKIGVLSAIIEASKLDRELYDALFNSVSGGDSFRNILKRNLNVKSVLSVLKLHMKEV